MKTIINLNLRKITNEIYYSLYKNQNRYLILYGGAGAGKSHYSCQKILFRIITEDNHRILICRKVARTLRRSVFQLFQDYISKWDINNLFIINKSEMNIVFKSNGNMILFVGIDDPEKLKSIERITNIWIEEATELSLNDFNEIDRRLRGKTKYYKQIMLSFNPIINTNWTFKRFFEGNPKNTYTLRTTYKDNKFLDNEYKELLEGYTGNARTVFTLGEYGKLEHAVYSNWDLIDNFPETDKAIFGLDFGFTNPQALVKVYLRENDLYLEERMYERKQTIPELISFLENEKLQNKLIVADSEAPATIEEIKRAGFYNIIACLKGPGSVEEGIKFMEGLKIHVTRGSTNLIKEMQSYQRKVDKDGNVLEVVEKSNDHLLDGARMVVYSHYFNKEQSPQVRFVGEDIVEKDEDDEDENNRDGQLDSKYHQI